MYKYHILRIFKCINTITFNIQMYHTPLSEVTMLIFLKNSLTHFQTAKHIHTQRSDCSTDTYLSVSLKLLVMVSPIQLYDQ